MTRSNTWSDLLCGSEWSLLSYGRPFHICSARDLSVNDGVLFRTWQLPMEDKDILIAGYDPQCIRDHLATELSNRTSSALHIHITILLATFIPCNGYAQCVSHIYLHTVRRYTWCVSRTHLHTIHRYIWCVSYIYLHTTSGYSWSVSRMYSCTLTHHLRIRWCDRNINKWLRQRAANIFQGLPTIRTTCIVYKTQIQTQSFHSWAVI
jgi:hypothetical protein